MAAAVHTRKHFPPHQPWHLELSGFLFYSEFSNDREICYFPIMLPFPLDSVFSGVENLSQNSRLEPGTMWAIMNTCLMSE